MNEAQRKQADIAYAGYLCPTGYFFLLLLLGPPQDAGAMLMLLLAMASVCATLVAFYHSLKLRGAWSTHPGLVVVPLALLPFFVVIIWEPLGDEVLSGYAVGAYVLISCFFCVRWFWRQRGRAVQEASQDPPSPQVSE